MSPTKALLLLFCVLALSACGSSKTAQPASTQEQAKTPPAIEAIDGPPSLDLEMPPDDAGSSSTYLCLGDCKATPDQAEKFRRIEEDFEKAVKPAEGTEPRAIARLRLTARGPTARARLIAWRNQSDKLCIETEELDENGGSSDGPSGPCVPESPCQKICLGLTGSRSGSASNYLLSGVVDSKADELQATFDDGRVVPYGLTGPLMPGFPGYRVFMLDLGRDLYQRLELRLSDEDLAEETLSRAQIQLLRCGEESPPALPGQDSTSRSSNLHECLQRAAPK